MDSIHFKTYFSMKKKYIFVVFTSFRSPTIHSHKTVIYLLSFEAFNDGMCSRVGHKNEKLHLANGTFIL